MKDAMNRSRRKSIDHLSTVCIETLEERTLLSVVPVGPELQVNQETPGVQQNPIVAADAEGNFVVVWQGIDDDGSAGIRARLFDVSANALTAEFGVNSTIVGAQQFPVVDRSAAGDFVVAWQSEFQDGSGTGVFARRFDAAGNALGGEFQVNQYSTGNQFQPSLAAAAGGEFVVTWSSVGQDGSGLGVYARRFGAGGTPVGSELHVSTNRTAQDQHDPFVDVSADGQSVIAWGGWNGGTLTDIQARQFDSAGNPLDSTFPVNTFKSSYQSEPVVGMQSDGGFVVVWHSHDQGGTSVGVYSQRYDSNGSPLGPETRVNSTIANQAFSPSIAVDADDSYVVTWGAADQDGSGLGVFARRFDARGNPLGNEFQINSTSVGDQGRNPGIAMLGESRFVVTWYGNGSGDSDGIYLQRFEPVTTTHVVTNTNDSGSGSLRDAILLANNTAGPDMIEFDIPGTGVHTIRPITQLPNLNSYTTIDGTSQPGYAGQPVIEIAGDGPGMHPNGLVLSGNHNRLRGLAVNRFQHTGVILFGDHNLVQQSVFGTDPSGSVAQGNGVFGVWVTNGGRFNVIGTDGDGVNDSIEGNLLSGNGSDGVLINQPGSDGNRIAGNLIGLDSTGTFAIPNARHGVHIANGSSENLVGTDGDGQSDVLERNVISGSTRHGVAFSSAGDGNAVSGNFVGTDRTGNTAVGNGLRGIWVLRTDSTRVGTDSDGIADTFEGNLVSGNAHDGIGVAFSSFTVVAGNLVGTDVSGTQSLGNARTGVHVWGGSYNVVGGSTLAERNVVSANGHHGVNIRQSDTTNNRVSGNFIGTDITGTVDLGNSLWGVVIANGTTDNLIGTDADGHLDHQEGNVISGNQSGGLVIGNGPQRNHVAGNSIGTDSSGTFAIANSGHGVVIHGNSPGNVIGTNGDGVFDSAEGNQIAFNQQAGVALAANAGSENTIRGNAVHSNGELGIDLGADGVDVNDSLDADSGTNDRQNAPVITGTQPGLGSLQLTGSMHSSALTSFKLDFYANVDADPSGYGEGQQYLGYADVSTDVNGNHSFQATLDYEITDGRWITATATNAAGSTSEFSAAIYVNRAPQAFDDSYEVNEDHQLQVSATGVLANDNDPDGDAISAQLVGLPANGTVVLQSDGSFTYTPDPDFNGLDHFTYQAVDGPDSSGVVTVHIDVLSASEQLDDILDEVHELEVAGSLNHGQANALSKKLDNVLKKLDGGQTNAAVNQLEAFINQVEDLIDQGVLEQTEGQPLIDAAQAAIVSILPGLHAEMAVGRADHSAGNLSMADLNRVLAESMLIWRNSGYTTVPQPGITISDLPGTRLGMASANRIWLDATAAGYGWHTSSAAPVADRIDLLSVVTHEIGHQLGHDHVENHSFMSAALQTGRRVLPADVVHKDRHSHESVVPAVSLGPIADFKPLQDSLRSEDLDVLEGEFASWSRWALLLDSPLREQEQRSSLVADADHSDLTADPETPRSTQNSRMSVGAIREFARFFLSEWLAFRRREK